MIRTSLLALVTGGFLVTAFAATADVGNESQAAPGLPHSTEVCMSKPEKSAQQSKPVYSMATSFSAPSEATASTRTARAGDVSDEEFARRMREFNARMPSAPSLNDTSTASAAPQYEERSPTNIFPYSRETNGLGPNGRLALYHIGVGIVGADLITHPQTVGLPPTFEYNIPHLPQEEPLWCWAAAAQQAIGWVNKGYAPTQCAIVALAHGIDVETCCGDREGVCAKTGEIPAIGRLVSMFGGQAYEMASVPRQPEQLQNIIEKGQTLLIRLRPAPHAEAAGIRHMIVVRGIEWTVLPNRLKGANLIYNDPLGSGIRSVTFDSIVGFFEQALIVRRSS